VWNATHDVTVGEKADSVGRLTVEAESYLTGQTKNAHATIDGDLTVGGKGAGTLGIGAGGAVTVGGALVFAEDEKSNGMLNEMGAGAVLTVTGPVTVGEAGTAVATVQAGGRFDASANDVTVGEEAKGQGLLVVTGAGSEIETAALTVAGASKDDNAEALSGGKLLVGGDLTIGDEQGSDGAVTVNDSGSALIVDGDATIGADGSGALLMTGGSASVKGAMTLGEAKNSTGKVILSAASLSVSGKLTIGELGSATALVQQGATVKSGAIEIGAGLGAKGSLTIDGSASSVTSGEITIGDGGVGSLKLTNGAKLTSGGDATIGNVALGAIVSASLDTGASWTVKGGLTVGDGGAASFSIAGKQTQVVVDGDMTVGASAGGTATLGSSTAASAATVEWGGVLTVGEGGKGALNINAGDSATALAGGPGALVIGEKAGSSGAVALLGAGARLTGADLVVGGAAAKAGGSGALSLAAGTQASFSAATIWKTGKVTDSGALTIGGPVSGNGKLQIMSGGLLTLNGSDTTVGLDFVAGGKGETLDLSADHLPAVQLVGFASSDVVDVAGLGHHDTISMKISGASAIVDFLQSGKAVGRLDFAVAAGQHDAFHFDAGTGALTLAAAH
jgi:T5SS/PEP-CTERM-associated repeat protein